MHNKLKWLNIFLIALFFSSAKISFAQDANAPVNPPPSTANVPPAPLNSSPAADLNLPPPGQSPAPDLTTPPPPPPSSDPNAPATPINPPPASTAANAPPAPLAETPATVAPSAPSSSELTQFQNWLKNNDQNVPPPLSSADAPIPPPPINFSQSSTTVVPPPPLPPKAVFKAQVWPSHVKPSPPLTHEESQQVMINSAPPAKPASAESKAAFNLMMQQNMPLTPEQVVRLRQLIDTSQRAASIPPTVPPKPVSTTLMINLAPGTTPPAIRLAQGYVSSLVFVDSTGSPWPIASFDIGDPKSINLQWDGKSNVLLIQAVSPYGDSNMVVRLVGLPTPITLQLVAGQRVVDYRADIHVSGIGPNTKELPTGIGLPNSANQLLLSVLDGIAPAGSKLLIVRGGDAQAWSLGNRMYLRTRFTLLSPGWVGRMVSPDGMNAYELQKTASVLVSQYGNPIELKIEGI